MIYKAIALDIDGTLLDSKGKVSERNIQMIKQLSEIGVLVILATGRYYVQMKRILKLLDFKGILVSTDGAVSIDLSNQTIVGRYTFPVQDIIPVIQKCREKNVYFSICTPFACYVEHIDSYQEEQCKKYEVEYQIVQDVRLLKEEVTKLTISDHLTIGGWQHVEYPNHLRKRADAEYFKEIVHKNTYKTNAIREILAEQGIKAEELIAIGDYYNDMDMLEYAGMGIAMGNAPDKVKSIAKDVTKSNDEDGVYYAIQKYVFDRDC